MDAQIPLICLFSAGTIALTYGDIARERGWQAGSLFTRPSALLFLAAALSIIAAAGLSLLAGPWWRVLVTVGAGFSPSSAAIALLRSVVQRAVLVALPLAWVWAVASVW
jgi:hypothetical protein